MLDKFIVKNKKGFTLIELLIVVAIIGILAAIAIPQFAQYRTRAFNSAAQSDLRTVRTTVEATFTDTYSYPVTALGAFTTPATASLTGVVGMDDVPLSTNVGALYLGEVTGTFYTISTFNLQGTRTFGTSQEQSKILFRTKAAGVPAVVGDIPVAASEPVWDLTVWTEL